MNPDDLRNAAFIVLAIALLATVAYGLWATHQLARRRDQEPLPPEWVNDPTPTPRAPCRRRRDYREDCTA